MQLSFSHSVFPTCIAFKFELAAGTGCTRHYACSETCDLCQPTKFNRYRWVLAYTGYTGAGHLSHYIYMILLLYIIGQKIRTSLHTSEEVSSLKKFRHTSSTLVYMVLAL